MRWGGEKEKHLSDQIAQADHVGWFCGRHCCHCQWQCKGALPLLSLKHQILANEANLEDECQLSNGEGWNKSCSTRLSHNVDSMLPSSFSSPSSWDTRDFWQILPSSVFFFLFKRHMQTAGSQPAQRAPNFCRVLLVLAVLVWGGEILLIHFQSYTAFQEKRKKTLLSHSILNFGSSGVEKKTNEWIKSQCRWLTISQSDFMFKWFTTESLRAQFEQSSTQLFFCDMQYTHTHIYIYVYGNKSFPWILSFVLSKH